MAGSGRDRARVHRATAEGRLEETEKGLEASLPFRKRKKGKTRLQIYPGAPHGLTLTYKEQFNVDLLAFLRSIAGAFTFPRLRAKLSSNALLLAASLVYAAALVGLVLVPNVAVILVLLIPTGIAWITVLAGMNATLQLFLPAWVRARGL